MSKSSRHKRTAERAQAARAIEAGDVGALAGLAASSPDRAAEALVVLLAREPPDAQVIAVAEDLAGRLRRNGFLAAARRIAAAGEKRSTLLRLELGLAAFASSDDAEAERVASEDAAVGRVLAPLFAAARGENVRARARTNGANRDIAELHAMARAVALARVGKVAEAKRALPKTPGELGGMLADAFVLAARRAGGKALLAQKRIESASVARGLAEVRAAAFVELAEIAPEPAMTEAKRCGVPADVLRRIAVRGSDVPPDAFEGSDAAAAWIHKGFSLARTNAKEAHRAFDRAIELDGDLVEALRGKLLTAQADGVMCGSCGVRHGDPRAIAAAAERLAKTLRRTPMGTPLAGEACVVAAETWIDEENAPAALLAIEAARADWGGGANERLDVLEAAARLESEPARALVAVDRVLEGHPENVEASRLKIAILKRLGRTEEKEAFIVSAAGATGDPTLRKLARRAAKSAPFDGFEPGKVSPGALAAELARAAALVPEGSTEDPMTALAWACRDALDAESRLAFDVAILFIGIKPRVGPRPPERLSALVLRWAQSPDEIFWLSAVMDAVVDGKNDRLAAATALASLPEPGPLVASLARGAAAAGDPSSAREILLRFSRVLKKSEIDSIKAALNRPRLEAVASKMDALERRLHPEFLFDDYAPGPLDDPWGEDDGSLDEAFSLPPDLLALLPRKLRAKVQKLEEQARQGQTLNRLEVEQTTAELIRHFEASFGPVPEKLKRKLWA